MSYQYVLPGEIEKRSFEILTKELGDRKLLPENEPVIKRVIHTTADFDYVDNLVFSEGAVTKAVEALKAGAGIVTDTQMALSGIHKSTLELWRDGTLFYERSGSGKACERKTDDPRVGEYGGSGQASGQMDFCDRERADRADSPA